MSERVRDAGEVSFPVPHAAGREREETWSCRGLLMSSYIPLILDERSSPFRQEFRGAAQSLSPTSRCCVPVIPSASLA